MKRLLALDGGGIRGYWQALMLAEIEQRVGKPCCEIFNLIAGTSIGGINACMLAAGVSAHECISFYRQKGPLIFRKPLFSFLNPSGFFGPRYPAKNIEAALQEVMKGHTLASVKTELIVPAYDLKSGRGVLFTSDKLSEVPSNKKPSISLWQVARATSSAQSYFPAFELEDRMLWDGGMAATNPAVLAYATAMDSWTSSWKNGYSTTEEPLIISIGCGSQTYPVEKYNNAAKWGLLRVALETLQTQMEIGPELVDYEMRNLSGTFNYYRYGPINLSVALDDASNSAFNQMDMDFRTMMNSDKRMTYMVDQLTRTITI